MKIQIVGLPTCKTCKALREAFNRSNINYTFSDCDRNPDNCDGLESLTGTETYPMVLIMDDKDTVIEVAYLAKDYNQLKEGSRVQNDIKLIANHSIDNLLLYVKNKLNL